MRPAPIFSRRSLTTSSALNSSWFMLVVLSAFCCTTQALNLDSVANSLQCSLADILRTANLQEVQETVGQCVSKFFHTINGSHLLNNLPSILYPAEWVEWLREDGPVPVPATLIFPNCSRFVFVGALAILRPRLVAGPVQNVCHK